VTAVGEPQASRPSWMQVGAVTAGQGGVAVTSGPVCASVWLHPARALGIASGVTGPGQRQQLVRHRGDLGGRGSLRGKTHRGWPVECCARRVVRRPVDRLVTGAAGPAGVAAAVSEACLVADEDPAGPRLWP
jgi:hypothetical protein